MPAAAGAFAVDACLIASRAHVVPVERCVVAREALPHPAQSGVRSGKRRALLAQAMTSGCVVELALAIVLQPFALVLMQFACVRVAVPLIGHLVATVREALAIVGVRVALICGRLLHARIIARPLDRSRAFGSTVLMLGMHLLQPRRLLVVLQRFTMQRGTPAMGLGQHRVARIAHQALAAFSGRALTTGQFARLLAQPARPTSTLAMHLRANLVHS